ncbi:MAG: hypothetical protein ACXWT0_00125 [Methylobacter sp.]
MARLTKDQWAEIRETWEADPREGFDWLVAKLSLDVSRQAVSKTAKAQGWVKSGSTGKVAEKVAQPKSCATKSKKVAQPKPKQKTKPVAKRVIEVEEVEWEDVDEKAERLHGNSKYDQRFNEQAYKLCLLGATDEELGDFFNVDESTINRWKISFPIFCESINRGKIAADAEVAASLFKRACGYQYNEVKTKEAVVMIDLNGEAVFSDDLKPVEVVTTVKEVSPDTGAAFIWLKNRRSKDWKDKQEIEINNTLGKDMLQRLETEMMDRLEASRARQRLVLIERGIVIEE